MLIITAFILFISFCLYAYTTRNNNYWKKRNVPHEKPKFLLGNFKDVLMGKKHFAELYADLYKKFENAPYVGFFRFSTPAVVLRDPNLIKSVLVKDFLSFDKNDFEVDESLDPILKSNIFTQIGEEWKKNRNGWTHGFTTNKLKHSFDTMTNKCQVMVDFIKGHIENSPDEALEAKDISSNFFIDVIVTSVFGLKYNSFEKENPFKKIVNNVFLPSVYENIIFIIITIWPKVGKLMRISLIPKKMENELLDIAKNVLKVKHDTGFQRSNAFDVILQRDDDDDGIEMKAAGLIFNFLMDGTETSAGLSGFVLYFLAANQTIQNKLREELDNHAEKNDGEITYDNINELVYMDMIISETLRHYPPSMALMKICSKPFEFPPIQSGEKPVTIEIGTPVIIPLLGLHMDPEYFPDPEKFDPERFSNENKSGINKFAYLPFGEGPRVCIGSRFANLQVKILIAGIIKNFQIRLSPKMKNKTITIEPTSFLCRAIGDIWITFHDLNE